MKITIYTKDFCPACSRAKLLLANNKFQFEEIKIGSDITREQVLEMFPDAKTVPIIIINDNRIGGADDLKLLVESGDINLL